MVWFNEGDKCCGAVGLVYQALHKPDPDYPKRPQRPQLVLSPLSLIQVSSLRRSLFEHTYYAMRSLLILSVLGLVVSRAEVYATELPTPHRPLEWKDMNVLSISDSHGESRLHR